MITTISASTLKRQLSDDKEIALLDTREHGEYGEGHPFYAIHLPYSALELSAADLIPNTQARIVLFGATDELAQKAAERLSAMGYADVAVLEDGVQGWEKAGYTLFKGVNVPSKAFGEIVEHEYSTPRITATELEQWQREGRQLAIFDGRTRNEFKKMSIPGAISCPNAELPYRIHAHVQDEQTPIIINCAGRTRSIIGAQSLINFGVKNPVYALENGTQGWYLNDFQLDHGKTDHYREVNPAAPALAAGRDAARNVMRRHAIGQADATQVQAWLDDSTRTTYLFDIRTPEEYAAGHTAGFIHAEGGQLVQCTDQYAAVRRARIVLWDADGIRAPLVASWLKQLGYETWTLPAEAVPAEGFSRAPIGVDIPLLPELPAAELAAMLGDATVQVLDLRPSQQFRIQHAEGAQWTTRSRIAQVADPAATHIVLLDTDARHAALAASELAGRASAKLVYVRADDAALRASGIKLVATPNWPADEQCIDFLFFVHSRHDGDKQAARQYLAWETNLIAQMDAQERATYQFS